MGPLPLVLAAIVSVTAARAILLYIHAIAANRVVLRMTTDIQKAALQHLISADFARLSRDTPGRLVSRLTNDILFIQQAAQSGLIGSVRDGLSIFALAIAMIYLDWVMSLIVLGIYPLAILPVMALGRRLRRVAKQTQAQVGDMTSLLTENLSSARLIKTYRLESYAASRMNASFETHPVTAHEGRPQPRTPRPDARSPRRAGGRRRHRVRGLADRHERREPR